MAYDIAHAAWFVRALADAAVKFIANATGDPVTDAAIIDDICCRLTTEYIQRWVEPEILYGRGSQLTPAGLFPSRGGRPSR